MKRILALSLWLLALSYMPVTAQRVLSLDSCRAMALRNNKQLSVSRVKQEVAKNIRKSARTKYLPHVSALGGYIWNSEEASILTDDQKSALNNLGSNAAADIQAKVGPYATILPANLQAKLGQDLTKFSGFLDRTGQTVVDAFRTDTRNTFGGAIVVTQPLFMGGAIVAMNKMADINEEMTANTTEARLQATLYNIDQAYWQVVSLRHKQKMAQSYLDVVKKLDSDVQKMISEGVATRSEGLSVSVKVNEAEMMLLKVSDGLVLSKMMLCQLCGLPVNEQVTLTDEETENLSEATGISQYSGLSEAQASTVAFENRPELKVLQNAVDLSKQTTNLLKAGNLPQLLLTGGWAGSNPNVYNGFQHKFRGAWNIGVLLRVPIWNWGDVMYKVRASKGATAIATLEMEEARELIELQVNQSSFRVNEANKKLIQAKSNMERAEENLRTATLGFREGVISSTTVMEAQTAWLQAQSQKIDAEIDVKLSEVNIQKAMGTLR